MSRRKTKRVRIGTSPFYESYLKAKRDQQAQTAGRETTRHSPAVEPPTDDDTGHATTGGTK